MVHDSRAIGWRDSRVIAARSLFIPTSRAGEGQSMSGVAFIAKVFWARLRANALVLTPKYFSWQVYEITETGPDGNAFRVGLVKFNRQSEVVDKRLVARIDA